MVAPTPLPEPKPAPPPGDWAKTTLWLGVAFIVAFNGFLVLRSCRNIPGDAIDKTGILIEKSGKALADVLSSFKQGKITTEFVSYASSISPTHRLQFATLKQKEIFTRKDEASTAFGYVPLPEVIVEARAPVEVTYYLDLNARWQLVLQDGVLHVLAPGIKFNTPAVDASQIKYEVRKDSAFRNSATAIEGLKQSITILARDRARENLSLVRETGRRQTGEFVEKWLMKSFADGKQYPVKVYFPDEKPPAAVTNASPLPFFEGTGPRP